MEWKKGVRFPDTKYYKLGWKCLLNVAWLCPAQFLCGWERRTKGEIWGHLPTHPEETLLQKLQWYSLSITQKSLWNQDRSRKARLLPFYNGIPIKMAVKYKCPVLTIKRHVVNPVQMDWESKICKIDKSCGSFKCSTGFQTSIYHDFPQQPQLWALCFVFFKYNIQSWFVKGFTKHLSCSWFEMLIFQWEILMKCSFLMHNCKPLLAMKY